MLVTDAGETILDTGDCAAFMAGERDGHHLQNRGGLALLLRTQRMIDEQAALSCARAA
ncbi:MAG: hypothetical protein WA709_19430 [Stellaceae bacterium]